MGQEGRPRSVHRCTASTCGRLLLHRQVEQPEAAVPPGPGCRRHGTQRKGPQRQDWSGATWRVLVECDTDDEALEVESQIIEEHMGDPKNLNKKSGDRSGGVLLGVCDPVRAEAGVQEDGPRSPRLFLRWDDHFCPARRLREHNGRYANGKPGNPKGGRYTSQHRPWVARACYGPYYSRSEALKAEYKLKRSKRGKARCHWTPEDSPLCRGEGVDHPWVADPVGWRPPKA